MEKIRNSVWLRGLCYVLIPIFSLILIISILGEIINAEYGNIKTEADFIQTDNFANSYYIAIIRSLNEIDNIELRNDDSYDYSNYAKIEGKNIYYKDPDLSMGYINKSVEYIIRNKQTGEIYTNIKINNVEEQINKLKNSQTYWYFENGEIKTNINKIDENNIQYNYSYYIGTNQITNYQNYEIYTGFEISKMTEFMSQEPEYAILLKLYTTCGIIINQSVFIIPIVSMLLIIMIIYLIWSIGHEEGKKGITLGSIDNIPYEFIFIIISLIITILMGLSLSITEATSNIPIDIIQSIYIITYFGVFACIIALVSTTIRRIKAKEFWHSFLIYKIWKKITKQVNKIYNNLTDKTNSTKKLTFFYFGFLIISLILLCFAGTFIGILLLIIFLIWTYLKLLEYNKQLNKIQIALRDIYEGKNDVHLSEEELQGVLKRMAKYINDIAGGFSNAIEQSLKSERLKTELITNVSHDIKTPLTSIINYVDLLKKEEFENKQIEQYIAILDSKSQRLKKLIEDLVEASKVSSGNVKLNIETINLKELINQTTGEFEDRFEKKKLKIETIMPEEDVILQADNRYMYRIIENLFSNITKYALENSRVYIELKKQKNKIELSMKNISSEKLNISADELMERFVRGDKSRHTEGSGLGISIAKSLTELQGGKFGIDIDGDLFKVNLKWE